MEELMVPDKRFRSGVVRYTKTTEENKKRKLEWQRANRTRINERRRKQRAANREKIAAAKRAWEAANPEMVRMQSVRRRIKRMNANLGNSLSWHYKVTLWQYNEILTLQENVCAICRTHVPTKKAGRLFVDHDHKTGALRALLCHRCNCGLGYFRDNLFLIRRALVYLEAFNGEGEINWSARVRSVLGKLPVTSQQGCSIESLEIAQSGRMFDEQNNQGHRAPNAISQESQAG